MKGDRFHNNFFQGTEKKCTGGGLPECLETTTVKKEEVVNTSKITTRWKRAAVAGHYGSVCLGVFFQKVTESSSTPPLESIQFLTLDYVLMHIIYVLP